MSDGERSESKYRIINMFPNSKMHWGDIPTNSRDRNVDLLGLTFSKRAHFMPCKKTTDATYYTTIFQGGGVITWIVLDDHIR